MDEQSSPCRRRPEGADAGRKPAAPRAAILRYSQGAAHISRAGEARLAHSMAEGISGIEVAESTVVWVAGRAILGSAAAFAVSGYRARLLRQRRGSDRGRT